MESKNRAPRASRAGSATAALWVGITLAACPPPPADPPPRDDDQQDAGAPADAGALDDAGPEILPCTPRASGTTSVIEGETIDVVVSCSAGATGVTLVVGALPDGAIATFEGEAVRLIWVTDLDDAQVSDVEVAVPERGESVRVHLAVADASLAPGNVPPVDPLRYTEEHGLPVIFISAEPAAEEYEPGEVIAGGHRYAQAELKLRGASSLGYPKRSLTLKLGTEDRLQLPSVGFVDRKKVVLISTFDDNAYVRQRLAYALYRRTNAGAPHTVLEAASVVVYVGGNYFGLYTLADHVDRDLFEETLGLDDGGNLYKSINHDANFRRERFPRGNGDKDFLGDGWELRDLPDAPVGQWDDLVELVAFVDDADAPMFDAEIEARIAVADIASWWVFATAVLGEDSYGKNAYLYKATPSSPFRYAPWDFNHSFGQAWETSRTDPHTPVDEGWPLDTNQLWERLLASAEHGPLMRIAYADALTEGLAVDEVLALFDAMVAEVDASARKDQAVWGDEYASYFPRGDLQDFDGEVAYTRAWISERWASLSTDSSL